MFLAVLAAVVANGGSDGIDVTVHDAAVSIRNPTLTLAAATATRLGTFPVLLTVATLTAVAVWLRDRRAGPMSTIWPSLTKPSLMMLALGAVECTVFVVKVAVARPRPPTEMLLGVPALDYSFPSGHTANGTVTWILAAVLITVGLGPTARRLCLALAATLSIAIGLSRIYLGYHWLTDVLAGWLLAAAIVCLALWLGQVISSAPHRDEIRLREIAAGPTRELGLPEPASPTEDQMRRENQDAGPTQTR